MAMPVILSIRMFGGMLLVFRRQLMLVFRFGQAEPGRDQDPGHETDREGQPIVRMKTNFRQDISQRNAEESSGADPQ